MKNLVYPIGICLAYSMAGCVSMDGPSSDPMTSTAIPVPDTGLSSIQNGSASVPHSPVSVQPVAASTPDESGFTVRLAGGNLAGLQPVRIASDRPDQAGDLSVATSEVTTSEVIVESVHYSLNDVESIALERNPTLAAARATSMKAVGLRNQVGIRPNPTLGYFGQQIADRGTDQHGVFVEQEFVRGNKLQLNREALGHTERAQAAEADTQVLRVLTDIRVRFYEAVAAQQQYDATQAFAKVAQRGVQVAQDRQNAAEGTLIETLQAETLLSEILLAAEQAEVAYVGAWKDLAAIAGLQQNTPIRLVGDLNHNAETPNWSAAYAAIVAESPELIAAQAIVCEKQALLRRQQAQPIPNVIGQLGAGYDDGTDHGMINVQLSAPIPVWNQNTGNVSAAYHEYVRATQEVQRIEQSIQSRLARQAQTFESAMKAVRKYEDEIIPQVNRSLELSEEAYRAGELDFLQVLVVRRSFYESSIRLIEAQGQLAQATAMIDGLLLTGGLDAPRDYTDGDGIRGASFGGQ